MPSYNMMLKPLRDIELGFSKDLYKYVIQTKNLQYSQINTVNNVEYFNAINETGYILFFSPF